MSATIDLKEYIITCPFCHSDDIIYNLKNKWKCLSCHKSFKKPDVIKI